MNTCVNFKEIKNSFLLIIFIMFSVGCGNEGDREEEDLEVVTEEPVSPVEDGRQEWNYENTDWQTLGSNECSSAVQSPVNIDTDEAIPARLSDINYEYEPFNMNIVDNGHTIQVWGTDKSFITVEGKRYQFKQFHFHAPAEHTIDDKRYPMEMHLVHQEVGTSNLVVLGVFIEEGAPNQFLEKVFVDIPEEKEKEITTSVVLTLSDYIPPAQEHFTYIGSLTTPPCTVGVDWIVFKEPIAASAEQIAKFTAIYANNARPVMPLNNRRVLRTVE